VGQDHGGHFERKNDQQHPRKQEENAPNPLRSDTYPNIKCPKKHCPASRQQGTGFRVGGDFNSIGHALDTHLEAQNISEIKSKKTADYFSSLQIEHRQPRLLVHLACDNQPPTNDDFFFLYKREFHKDGLVLSTFSRFVRGTNSKFLHIYELRLIFFSFELEICMKKIAFNHI
jgi:hypothetical protein